MCFGGLQNDGAQFDLLSRSWRLRLQKWLLQLIAGSATLRVSNPNACRRIAPLFISVLFAFSSPNSPPVQNPVIKMAGETAVESPVVADTNKAEEIVAKTDKEAIVEEEEAAAAKQESL